MLSILSLQQKLTLEVFLQHLIIVFFTELIFLNQMSYFSRNLNHHSKCRVRKEIFQTILTTIFWNFSIFYHRPDQPQVKRKVVATTTSLVYGFSHELPNDLRLRILGNKEMLGKSLIWFEKGQVPLPEIKLWNSNQKSRHN